MASTWVGTTSSGHAADNGSFGHVGLGLTTLSGEKNKSLGSPNPMVSLEFAAGKGTPFIGYLFKVRLDSSSGTANFLDATTSRSLSYSLLAGSAALGFRVSPLPKKRERGMNLYVGGALDLGLAQLTLPQRTYTKLSTSESAISAGYELFAGIDFIVGSSSKPWGIFTEIVLRQQSASLAGQSSFALGGLMIIGGISW